MSTESRGRQLEEAESAPDQTELHEYHSATSAKGIELEPRPAEEAGGQSVRNDRRENVIGDRFWKDIRRWADVTTFHGIRNIFDEQTSIYRRGFWLVCVCVFLVVSLWFCQDQLNRYLSYRTLIEEVSLFPETIPFPAITICSYSLIKNDSIHDHDERQLLNYLYQAYQPNKTHISDNFGATFLQNVSLRRIFEEGSISAEELFERCYWETSVINCSEWTRILTSSGYCYTFNANYDVDGEAILKVVRMTGKTYGLHVTLWTSESNHFISENDNIGFMVAIHNPDEYPDMNHAISLVPGYAHYIAVTKHKHIYMPHPVRAFGDKECFDKTADMYAGKYENYTANQCLHECRVQYIYDNCGCVGPLDPEEFQECDPLQIVDCYQSADKNFTSYAADCYCPVACKVTEYRTKVSSAALAANRNIPDNMSDNMSDINSYRRELTDVYIYYEDKVIRQHEQVLAVTFETLWGTFGGLVGIAVGCSIVTFAEAFELLLVQGFYYCRHMRDLVRDDRPAHQ